MASPSSPTMVISTMQLLSFQLTRHGRRWCRQPSLGSVSRQVSFPRPTFKTAARPSTGPKSRCSSTAATPQTPSRWPRAISTATATLTWCSATPGDRTQTTSKTFSSSTRYQTSMATRRAWATPPVGATPRSRTRAAISPRSLSSTNLGRTRNFRRGSHWPISTTMGETTSSSISSTPVTPRSGWAVLTSRAREAWPPLNMQAR